MELGFINWENSNQKSTKLTLKRLNSFDMERFAQDEAWVENKKSWTKIKSIWKSFREDGLILKLN